MCEICGATTRERRIGAHDLLMECTGCGHLHRDLRRAPAGHRDLAYGGEATLDRVRLDLTYRSLRRAWRLASGPTSVFEVGFGTGSMLRRFLDDGAHVAGADPDQLGLAVDPQVREHGDLHALPIEQVDPVGVDAELVFGIHVLEHVIDPLGTLRTAAELTRPGGQLQFLTPAGDSDGLRIFGADWWMLEDPTHVRFFTETSLRRAAAQAGLVEVQVRRPALDSITTDAASVARRLRRGDKDPRGALASRAVLAAGAASTPIVVAVRGIRASARPTLHLIARRPT